MISHSRSLYNECDQCATAGLVHLTVGRVHLELAGFCKALEAFQRAHKIAHSIQDPSLELQVIRSFCFLVPSCARVRKRALLLRCLLINGRAETIRKAAVGFCRDESNSFFVSLLHFLNSRLALSLLPCALSALFEHTSSLCD